MPVIKMNFADRDATEAWPDLAAKDTAGLVTVVDGLHVSVYQNATVSGAPSACFRFDLADGQVIIAQVTVRNLLQMHAAVMGRLAFLQIDENGTATGCPPVDRN